MEARVLTCVNLTAKVEQVRGDIGRPHVSSVCSDDML